MIQEVIVVEGKNDIRAVKNACDCECIASHGHGFGDRFLEELVEIEARRGLIILTDPDYAGEKIRHRIKEAIPTAKDAYIDQKLAAKTGDIGIEHCGPELILDALKKCHARQIERREEFSKEDFFNFGLEAVPLAKERRILLGKILGIGYGNSRKMLFKLNDYGIKREEFEEAMKKVEEEIQA